MSSILNKLSALALEGAGELAGRTGAGVTSALAGWLSNRFSDHSQRLTRALERAQDRAWRAVELALAGSSWWGRCKGMLGAGDERAFRDQVEAFLRAHPLDGVDGHGPNFRAQCVAQLQAARKAGILSKGKVNVEEVAERLGDLSRFG